MNFDQAKTNSDKSSSCMSVGNRHGHVMNGNMLCFYKSLELYRFKIYNEQTNIRTRIK